MKYAIIIPDGAAVEPLKELGGKTPIEAAHTPHMDRVAIEGRRGHGAVRVQPQRNQAGVHADGGDVEVHRTERGSGAGADADGAVPG